MDFVLTALWMLSASATILVGTVMIGFAGLLVLVDSKDTSNEARNQVVVMLGVPLGWTVLFHAVMFVWGVPPTSSHGFGCIALLTGFMMYMFIFIMEIVGPIFEAVDRVQAPNEQAAPTAT